MMPPDSSIKPRRYLVFGAGAIGSVFACLLDRHGCEVSIVGRDTQINAIRNKGLFVDGIWGEHHVMIPYAVTSIEQLPSDPFDVVFISVKAYDTEAAVESAAPYLAPDGLMVSLQNGLDNVEKIANVVGAERTVGARVIFGAEIEKPGKVNVTVYADPVIFGSPGARAPESRIHELVTLVNASGIPSQYSDEIEKYIWSKVLYNIALNPLSTILRVPYGHLLKRESTRELMPRIVEEAFEVAGADGQELFWNDPGDYIDLLYTRLIPLTASHHPSMLQDIENNKKTEIDALNGAIVKLGEKHGIAIPVNYLLTALIKALEPDT